MGYKKIKTNSDRWLDLKDLPNEEWRDIKDFEGLYRISNYGRIKSKRNRILREAHNQKGYSQICLFKDSEKHTRKVHRLVAQAFIPNPDNLPEINHIDKDKTNNTMNNLEWCDTLYNINYSLSKPIIQYDLDGNFVKRWASISDACKNLNKGTSLIFRCCKNKNKSAYNYIWKYENGGEMK